jgi:general L-amino acid transport system substrate-binding protein
MDADYCRAVSAAIFSGSVSVVFSNLPSSERFRALSDGEVDLVSAVVTLNMERDVSEPSTKGEGFAFSQPMFYDGLTFGGLPEYVYYDFVLYSVERRSDTIFF